MDPKFTWDIEEPQVPKESLEKLVKSFFFAEQIRWAESSSPVRNISAGSCHCCNSSLSQDGIHCTKLDPGFEILRHGKNIRSIHAYFQNLEPHRYRLKLTAGNKVPDRPDSMRMVKRVDSRVDRGAQNVTDTSIIPTEIERLNEQDWQLYEMVVLCYQAPYLSAPPVPSPYSPSSSPTSPSSLHQFEFSYSPPPSSQVHSPFQSKAFFLADRNSPDTTPPANTHAMRELVRKSYGLTKQMHAAREKQIKEKILPKNSERVLVEDLLTQLNLLNNNCHPYYHIQSFLDKNGYDEWVTTEKEHINRLIKVFWHFPLPPCTSACPLNQFDANKGYEILLKRFIRHESANKTSHSVFGDVTPTAPLSSEGCRILKEFGLRYGVGELYRKLIYLRYLVDHFECELWVLRHVAKLVDDVMKLVTATPEIYVKEEFAMLLHVLTLLLRLSKYYLTRVTRLFPKNSPPGGVTALVTMAELAQDASLYLNAKFPSVLLVMAIRNSVHEFKSNLVDEPFEVLLSGFLKEEIEIRYERFKVIAAYKLEVDSYDPPLTPNLLNILIYDIQEELTIYRTYYQEEFEKYVDFVQLATVTFYKLLMEDVHEMCAHTPHQQNKVDLRLLALAYRLSMLDRDLAKYLTPELQTWREPLLQLSLAWVDIVGRHLKRLVPVLLEKEPWRPVEVTIDDIKTSARSSLPSNVMKISSKQQLFTQSCNSAFRRVQSDMDPASKPSNIMSVSNPYLNKLTNDLPSSAMDTDTDKVSEFKGKTILTKAIVHIPSKPNETSENKHDGLSRSCPIEDLFFQTDSDSGKDITTIDNSCELDNPADSGKPGDNNEPSKIMMETGTSSQAGQTGLAEIVGHNGSSSEARQAGATSQTNANEQTAQTSKTGQTSQTEQTSSNENLNEDVGEDTTPNPGDSHIEVLSYCKTLVTDLVSSLTGYDPNDTETRDTTPYENVDDVSSGTSSNYKTADSSLDDVERTHTGLNVGSNMSDVLPNFTETTDDDSRSSEQCTSSSTYDVEVVTSRDESKVPIISNALIPQSPDKKTSTVDVCSNCPRKLSNIVADKSKMQISDTLIQQPHDSKTVDVCSNCPRKTPHVVADIEDTSKVTSEAKTSSIGELVTTFKDIKMPDEDWNKPGPSGVQTSIKVANKHLSKALESDIVSMKSEYGSAPTHVTLTSYETAQYNHNGNSSSELSSLYTTSMDSSSGLDPDSPCEMGNERPSGVEQTPPTHVDGHTPRTELLPISSSAIDLLCCINRFTSFVCHLCTILCPSDVPEGSVDSDVVKRDTQRMKTALCTKLIHISKDMIFLYADSLLAVETCGITDSELISILGTCVAADLIDRCTRGDAFGCRHNPGRPIKCNSTDSKGNKVQECPALNKVKQKSLTGCESASSKMGIRNSDVTIIESLLPWLHDRITMAISCNKSASMGLPGQKLSSETYCHNGPSVDSHNRDQLSDYERQCGHESRLLSQSVNESLDECSVRLDKASDIQCQLVAKRLNDLFVKILHQLLNLSLPTFDIKKRLQPIIEFLHKRLTSLRKVMFAENFLVTIKHLWRHVVQDFSEEVELLKERRLDATEQSVLLLNSMAYLMQFFHGYGRGISYDELLNTTQVVTKHIELYTAPTSRLIRLYRWLYDQMLSVRSREIRNVDEFVSSISTSSHQSRAHAPTDQLIQTIRVQLHAKRKCFSGTDFVDWVKRYVHVNGYDSLGVCIGITDTETGIELGQYLLERNFLTCVTFPHVGGDDDDDDDDSDEQPFSRSRATRSSKGAVLMKDSLALSSQMRFNDISITRANNSSHPASSKSSSRPATDTSELINDADSSSSLASEDMDTRDLLDSVDIILRQANSEQSTLQFQHSPDVFYSFLNDEEGSGNQFKYRLDFVDRFSIRIKLEQIICVLYTRKKKDIEAKQFLKRLPKDFIAQAIGYKETPICFHI